jgi:hypothetical protein
MTCSSEAGWSFVTAPCPAGATCTYQFSGTHRIRESNGGGDVIARGWTAISSYRGTINASGNPGFCYFGDNDGTVWMNTCDVPGCGYAMPWQLGTGGPFRSSSDCIPQPPLPPSPRNPPEEVNGCPTSPILINLGTGGYDLTGIEDPVSFDIDADGVVERLSWSARNAPLAFLALDRNGNGVVDDGAELFGNSTPLPSGQIAPDGFVALAPYDRNGDDVIDVHDPIWSALLLWTDRNHDGVSQREELQPIAASEIEGIELAHHEINRRDAHGNRLRYAGAVHIARGARICYDVFFRLAP